MPDASVFPREEANANLAARPSLRSAHARQESRLHRRGCTDAGAGDWRQCRDFQCSELAASASAGDIARAATGRDSSAVRKAQPKEHCGVGAGLHFCARPQRDLRIGSDADGRGLQLHGRRLAAADARVASYLAVVRRIRRQAATGSCFRRRRRPTRRQPRGRALPPRVEVHLRRRREHRGTVHPAQSGAVPNHWSDGSGLFVA